MNDYDGPRRELESELARELQTATADSPPEFEAAVVNVGLNPEEFIAAMDECFPQEQISKVVGDEVAELMRVYLGNGIIIGIQFQQNRFNKAMDNDESEATT